MSSSPIIIPVILAGGAGTRLWPLSRKNHPKPFIELPDGETLLQKTYQRVSTLQNVQEIITITNRDYYFLCKDTAALCADKKTSHTQHNFQFLLEPEGRNTAPAITLAALHVQQHYGDNAKLLVLPADHLIEEQNNFAHAVATASQLPEELLVTFGILPNKAETGYGYIEQGEKIPNTSAHLVTRFVEKPDQQTAQSYLESKKFLWNSGMFCFSAQTFLKALKQHREDIYTHCELCWQESETTSEAEYLQFDKDSFQNIPSESIDYAVMEQADNVAVVPAELGWSDIGSFTALQNLIPGDADGNHLHGDTIALDLKNCYIHGENRLIAGIGLENLAIIDTADALLIAPRDRCQEVKAVVKQLKEAGHEAHDIHRTVVRPWGSYTVLEEGSRFKIKRIVVKAGERLSLQMHHHRSEHWVVVSGTAEVTNGDKEFLLFADQSTYIPSGNKHRLGNPGNVDLVMIEVQSGEYLGEDDIVRFDDVYGRSS